MTVSMRFSRPIAGIAALLAVVSCSSDVTGGARHSVQLSFTTNAGISSAANRVAADLVVGESNELVIQKVQLVFGKLELDRTGTTDCVGEAEAEDDNGGGDDHGRHEDGCEDVSRNPLLVDVPLDDALHPVINVPLPAGNFRELEAKLEPARDRFTDFNTAHPDLVGKSVRVEGTFNGTPFVFSSAIRSKLEMEFDPALVIDETTRNATVSIDVRKWFVNTNGAVIDPSTATPESNNQQQIESNIRRSFHAFEDDEERGEDHHDGHHGNDDGEHH